MPEIGVAAEGMDYSKLTPLLIEVAKAQQELIDQQQEKLNQLEEKMTILEKLLQEKINK